MVENVGEDRGENPWNIPQGNVSETAEKRLLAKPMQSLREAYGYSMISHQVRHLELSTYKGTKKVRETSDIVIVLPTENTKDTKRKTSVQSV